MGTHRTMVRSTSCGVILIFSTVSLVSGAESAATAEKAAATVVANIEKAFKEHNAAALAALWKEDAVHTAKSSGERTEGRKALQESYAKLFKEDPKSQLKITVGKLRQVTPGVLHLDGVADVQHSNGEVSRSEVSAILVQQNGAWLVDQVQETDLPLASQAATHLSELDWLLGKWSDETKEGRVENETHWNSTLNYLVRNYRAEAQGATVREGMQIIGWDAEQKCLRSWLFEGDGSVGEGTWQRSGDNKWINKMVLKLADGRRASMAQVFQPAGDNKLMVETVDREVDGEAQPNSGPMTLSRPGQVTPPAAKSAAK
jgi:uncharacterized protein (TIGR02246 family)